MDRCDAGDIVTPEPRACADCKYFWAGDFGSPEGRCVKNEYRVFDVVKGWQHPDARQCRNGSGGCGPNGNGWEKRKPVPKTLADYVMAGLIIVVVSAFFLKGCMGVGS